MTYLQAMMHELAYAGSLAATFAVAAFVLAAAGVAATVGLRRNKDAKK